MKLLFDQNLSFKLCLRLKDYFPNSEQVRLLGMAEASDQDIWHHAAAHEPGFGLRGYGRATRATAKSVVAAMREPTNRKNRTDTPRAPHSYRIL